jgi:hypothetical protein
MLSLFSIEILLPSVDLVLTSSSVGCFMTIALASFPMAWFHQI